MDRMDFDLKIVSGTIVDGMVIREDNTDTVAPDGDLHSQVLCSSQVA